VSICGAPKDLIKSGGEWINLAEIEDIVGTTPPWVSRRSLPGSDAKWGERPVLIVEWRQGLAADGHMLLEFLRGKVAAGASREILRIDAMPLARRGR